MVLAVLQNRLFRPRIVAVMLLLAAVACAPQLEAKGKHPQRKEDLKAQVEQLEDTWRMAQLNDDVATMDKLLSDDYVGITMTGQVVTKMQQLDRMRNREVIVTKIGLDDVKVKILGTTAIVTCLADVDGTNAGASIHGTYRYTRVYLRLPSGTWKITNFEATRVGVPASSDGKHPHPKDPKAE